MVVKTLHVSYIFWNFRCHQKILKVGVACVRYVALCHCRPWVAHSFRNTRGRGSKSKNEQDDVADSLTIQNFVVSPLGIYGAYLNDSEAHDSRENDKSSSSQTTDKKSSETEPMSIDDQKRETVVEQMPSESFNQTPMGGVSKPVSETCEHVDGDKLSGSETEKSSHPVEQAQKESSTEGSGQTEASSSQKSNESTSSGSTTTSPASGTRKAKSPSKKLSHDLPDRMSVTHKASTFEKIRIQIYPWRKPEGPLNRQVFRTVLEALMLHIMANPGITNKNIFAKYNPFFQPFCLLVLLEVLEDIGCIQKKILRDRNKTTLFSSPVSPTLVAHADDGDATCYEAAIDSISRLGHFLAEVDAYDQRVRR